MHGTCVPGFEEVRDLFERNFHIGGEANAQLCIYVDGQCVIDLYGTAIGDTNYGPNTLQVSFQKALKHIPLQ